MAPSRACSCLRRLASALAAAAAAFACCCCCCAVNVDAEVAEVADDAEMVEDDEVLDSSELVEKADDASFDSTSDGSLFKDDAEGAEEDEMSGVRACSAV